MLARFAPCHRMGGYLFFKSSGLLFPRLTKQNPFTRHSRSPSFGAAVAKRNSERTGLLSEGTRGTLECSRDGFNGRFVS